jgi:hypothetical protein
MRPSTEAPPQDPSTDGDRSLLQRVFGHAEPDRHDDQNHAADTVEGPTEDPTRPENQQQRHTDEQIADQRVVADQHRDEAASNDEQPPDAVADDAPHGERRTDGPGDIHRDDEMSTTHDDEPAPFEESARYGSATGAPVVDEPAAGPPAEEPTSLDAPADLKPGDVPAVALTVIWADGSAQDLRERWREAQLRFIDDPRKAADDTRSLVNEAVEAVTTALAGHREQLNSWSTDGDTEQYRVVMQRYRTFLERLLTL